MAGGAIDIAMNEIWAIEPGALSKLLAIAARQNEITPEALEAYRAGHAERGQRLRVRDGIGIIDVEGPLFKRANLFQAISGASSYSIMAQDLQTALDDPAIRGIILNIDSPGGTVAGCDELASAIFAARGKKPITSVVSGTGASAAYWIATAADRVVLSDASAVGSIGVVAAIDDRTVADERRGVRTIQFVSSRAPGKRPDYDTDAGRAVIQRQVDAIEEVFINAVAKHRGVTTAKVVSDFGAGAMVIGANAVKAGMADAVGSFEDAFAALKGRRAAQGATISGTTPASALRVAADANPAAAIIMEEKMDEGATAMQLAADAREATARVSALVHRVGRGEASRGHLELAIAERDRARARLNALADGGNTAAQDAAVAEAQHRIDAGAPMRNAVAALNARNARSDVPASGISRAHLQDGFSPELAKTSKSADPAPANPMKAVVARVNARRAAVGAGEVGTTGSPMQRAIAEANARTAAANPGLRLAGGTRPTPAEGFTNDEEPGDFVALRFFRRRHRRPS